MKNWLWPVLIVTFVLVALACGVVYWSFFKTQKLADSALNSANNPSVTAVPSSSASSSGQAKPTLTMPAEEAAGEDLADVPRFPDSIRSFYEKLNSEVTNIEYFAPATVSQIFAFYKEKLAAGEWVLRAEDNSTLNFSQDNLELSVEIIDQDKSTPITQYRIHYIRTQDTE